MANVIIASSSKPVITPLSTPTNPKLKLQIPQIHSLRKTISLLLNNSSASPPPLLDLSSSTLKSLTFVPPSLPEEEMAKASFFDFNLTLTIIMVEFLLLMFTLNNIYFTPLINFMDKRDASIKEKLSSVKDTSEEVKKLDEQAAMVLKAAKAEISATLNKMKKDT